MKTSSHIEFNRMQSKGTIEVAAFCQRLFAALVTAFALYAVPALGDTTKIDVGNGQPVAIDTAQPIKIALFIEIGTNSAVQKTIEGAKAEAAKHNIQVDVFDARFDIARQVNQMQNALNGGYNAWIVAAVEGQQVCNMAAVEAPKRDIVVAVVTMAICQGHSVLITGFQERAADRS